MMPRILITPGEPAGIGADVTVQIAQQAWPCELIVIADPQLLLQRAKQLGLSLQLLDCNLSQAPTASPAGTLKIIAHPLHVPTKVGVLNPGNSAYVMQTLETATALCLQKQADAIVTGPVHKEIMNAAGIAFTGHTEFLADCCHVAHTVMLFVVDQLKVALATTHLPLAKVPQAITKERLQSTLDILHAALIQHFKIVAPRILVCGLNPHAGEGGYLGREEIEVIAPLLRTLRDQGLSIAGPLAADTIFTPHHLQQADVILAMYHDQALPLIKYIGFDRAVNLTLGLPFIRTSVDHGTALDVAGTGRANAGSMHAALKLAIELATPVSIQPLLNG